MALLGLHVVIAAFLISLPEGFTGTVRELRGPRARTDGGFRLPDQARRLAIFSRNVDRSPANDRAIKLPPDDVVVAVARAGTRVTCADVAAIGGMSLADARDGLRDLASAVGGDATLDVSQSGEHVYVLPKNVAAALSQKSSAAAAREAWKAVKPAVLTVLRTAFGLALFVSIAVMYSAVIALSSSRSERGRNDRQIHDTAGGGSRGGFGFTSTYFYGPSPFDMFYLRPYYSRDGYSMEEEGSGVSPALGLLEAVYSFVFGDGDPNDGRETHVLSAVAALARRNGGVLTAGQLAPLLTPPDTNSSGTLNVDESWVLPTLSRLNGRPEVTKGGEIVYVFDGLQTTAGASSLNALHKQSGEPSCTGDIRDVARPPSIIKEKRIPFSLASKQQLVLVGLLGATNLFGAGFLGVMLANLRGGESFPTWLRVVQFAYPGFMAFGISFFAAPLVRYFNIRRANKAIEAKNKAREQWLRLLQSGACEDKLLQARDYATVLRRVCGDSDVVYSTGKAAAVHKSNSEIDDFDIRLRS